MSNSSSSDMNDMSWIVWFLSLRGNEFFCAIDRDYIADRFNLCGLNADVPNFSHALHHILDQPHAPAQMHEEIEKSARHLYGLIHARFVLTPRGISKMAEKYKRCEFGTCPRTLCRSQPCLPVGLSDHPFVKSVKLYCPRCEDVYLPRSTRHAIIDGAYFGRTFPHLFLHVNPSFIPTKYSERYVPRIFGFKLHEHSQSMVEAPKDAGLDDTRLLEKGDAKMPTESSFD